MKRSAVRLNNLFIAIFLIISCNHQKKATSLTPNLKNKMDDIYYTLTEFKDFNAMQNSNPPKTIYSYELIPLNETEKFVRIDVFTDLNQAKFYSQEVYKNLFKIAGKSEDNPGYLIYAEWKLEDTTKIEPFIKSRETLFSLRQKLLANFSFDILTKNLYKPNQFLILGFYKDENGLEQARNHPEIKIWAAKNTAAHYAATDIFVPKRFIIHHSKIERK